MGQGTPPPSTRRPIGLALPFGAIGLAGSALVADAVFGSYAAIEGGGSSQTHEYLRVAGVVIVVVTGMCALLGRAVRDPVGKGVFVNGFLLAAAVALAGGMSGATAAMLASFVAPKFAPLPFWALAPAGGYLGLLLAPAFWVPLAAVFFVRWKTGEARPGSILAGSERQRVWVATTFVIAVGAGVAIAAFPSTHATRETIVAVAGVAALGLLTFAAVARLNGMLSVVRGVARIAEPHDVPADVEVDLGIGDEWWTTGIKGDDPYRGVGRIERGVRGAIFEVQRRLTRAVLVDAGLFVASLLLLFYAVAHQAPSPPPAIAVAPPPAPPLPASTLPPAGMRWLSWYPLSAPILVDINGDGREDIVGLRWNAGQEARALSVTATDGATLAPMWQAPPIPCQWANPQVRLLRSGDRLFLSDSEKLVHVYDLRTGTAVGEPVAMPENGHLGCADTSEASEATPRVWLWAYPKPKSGGGEFVLDGSGNLLASTEPKWCERRTSHPACARGGKGGGATHATSGVTCEAYHDYRLPSIAPQFNERYSLEEGDAAVAIGFRRLGDPWSQADTLVGYDPKTHKVRWDQPVARDLEAHAFPRVQVDLHDGKVFTFYQGKTGAWELSARDAHTGDALWATEPPRAMEGTNFDTLTLSRQGVYLGISNRLEVFDPGSGASRGVVW